MLPEENDIDAEYFVIEDAQSSLPSGQREGQAQITGPRRADNALVPYSVNRDIITINVNSDDGAQAQQQIADAVAAQVVSYQEAPIDVKGVTKRHFDHNYEQGAYEALGLSQADYMDTVAKGLQVMYKGVPTVAANEGYEATTSLEGRSQEELAELMGTVITVNGSTLLWRPGFLTDGGHADYIVLKQDPSRAGSMSMRAGEAIQSNLTDNNFDNHKVRVHKLPTVGQPVEVYLPNPASQDNRDADVMVFKTSPVKAILVYNAEDMGAGAQEQMGTRVANTVRGVTKMAMERTTSNASGQERSLIIPAKPGLPTQRQVPPLTPPPAPKSGR